MPRGLDDREYRRRTAALRRKQHPCWLCNEPIDYTLDYRDRMSFTADHKQPRANGGHLLGELRAAHRACNSSRSNRVTTVETKPTTRRQW